MIYIGYSELTKRYYLLPKSKKESKVDITSDIEEILAANQPAAAPKGDAVHSALLKAVELIKQWHNMQAKVNFVSKPIIEHTWQIYWNNAPEMKPIREALEASRPADWKQKLADYLGYKSFDDLDTAESSVANWIEKNVL